MCVCVYIYVYVCVERGGTEPYLNRLNVNLRVRIQRFDGNERWRFDGFTRVEHNFLKNLCVKKSKNFSMEGRLCSLDP